MAKISIDNIGIEIAEVISQYTEEVSHAIEEEIDNTANKIKDDIVANAPKNKGEYAKGFKVKKEKKGSEVSRIIHNDKKPGLVHLLELGHATNGGTGRVKGKPHLQPSYDRHIPQMEKNIENIIKNGGK